MSNQSFDSNGISSASGLDSGAKPIPIAQQVRQQSYLSNIQHKLEEIAEASSAEAADENFVSPLPSSSPTPTPAPAAPKRFNKMDAFFEQVAAEEEAAANALAAEPAVNTEAEDAQLAIGGVAEHPPVAPQLEAATIPEGSPNVSPETTSAAPPAESRPTGYAGLSAGLAAAGLGNFGARLAEESTMMSDTNFVGEESNLPAAPQALPPTPTIPVIEPSFSAHSFDLEAVRLEEAGGTVFSQDFEEKELSPEERLANRLKREKLVSSENRLADQLQSSPPPSMGQQAPVAQQSALYEQVSEGNQAPVANPTPVAEQDHQGSEPIADLFVEVPQVQQPVDQLSAYQQSQTQHAGVLAEQTPGSTDTAVEIVQPNPLSPPEADSPETSPAEPQVVLPEPSAPAPQPHEEAVDPRLLEAIRLEEEFKQLQQRQESYIEEARREQIEHARPTQENLNSNSEHQENTQRAEEDRLAAIRQAERVKEVRGRANQFAGSVVANQASAESTDRQALSQHETASAPEPLPLSGSGEGQLADQPAVVQPAPLQQESLASGAAPSKSEKPRAKGGAAGHQFPIELFYACMLEHLSDGVVFVDHKQRVKMWSRGAEKATGITPNVVLDRQLLPQTINLCDTVGNGLQLDKCPVARSLRTLEIVSGEYKISNGTSSEGMKVELTVIPVIDKNRYVNGAVVMFHDRTAQVNLQQQLKDLYEFSVLDPLTQVANRAEFERVQQEYVLAFQQSDDFNCSIIICDIDFFKSINDNFGHKVGDEALMSFAEMLKRYVRPQDLVARYGGEEFVILCADCDTAAAVQRAEEIRMALYKTPQPMLGGKSISASFGVSELREGDTATDFFVRADTALLKAKESGRNRVVAGDGSSPNKSDEPATELSATGIRWSAQQRKSKALLCEEFKTETPIQVLVEKLRGYIIENDAVLQRVEPEFLSMEIEVEAPSDYSKKGAFTMNVEFKEDEEPISDTGRTKTLNYIRVTIYAGRMRSWFSTNHTDLAPHLLGELRRFLMIGDKASRISVDMATQKVR